MICEISAQSALLFFSVAYGENQRSLFAKRGKVNHTNLFKIFQIFQNYNDSHNKKAQGALLPGLHFVAVALVVKA